MSEYVTTAALIGVAALLVAAALHDLACRTIPNWIPVALVLTGLILRLASGQLLDGIVAGIVVFVASALLWRRGFMGGGDVKLLGATAIVVPSGLGVPFIVVVAFAGGLLALTYMALRHVVPAPGPIRPLGRIARIARVERRRIRECRSLPYACAIASGALFILARG
jgi:prepilin peptidase CpaA